MRLPYFSYEASSAEVKAELEKGLPNMIFSEFCRLVNSFGNLRLNVGLFDVSRGAILGKLKFDVVTNILDITHVDCCESA